MAQQPLDITPQNGGKFPWGKPNTDVGQFEDEFSLRKVAVSGIFDHTKEFQVAKVRNGEKGFDRVTPFFTHLNEKCEECGIMVNRGWVPEDLLGQKVHYMGVTSGKIVGLLYRGDAKNKYSTPNDPMVDQYHRVDPYDMSLVSQLRNLDEASKFMILQIDEDPDARQVHPSIPTADELVAWKISPERHEAYAKLWRYLTFAGVFANTALWLYF